MTHISFKITKRTGPKTRLNRYTLNLDGSIALLTTFGAKVIVDKNIFSCLPKARIGIADGYPVFTWRMKQILLHRWIMGFPKCNVDHKNGNKLDNRMENLRLCNTAQNTTNHGPLKRKKYKGVYKDGTLFRASICAYGKRHYKHGFKTEEDAALWYNNMAKELHGEFAFLNNLEGI